MVLPKGLSFILFKVYYFDLESFFLRYQLLKLKLETIFKRSSKEAKDAAYRKQKYFDKLKKENA
jgi:hypothetical protein